MCPRPRQLLNHQLFKVVHRYRLRLSFRRSFDRIFNAPQIAGLGILHEEIDCVLHVA
jgi:hypothetical protein